MLGHTITQRNEVLWEAPVYVSTRSLVISEQSDRVLIALWDYTIGRDLTNY